MMAMLSSWRMSSPYKAAGRSDLTTGSSSGILFTATQNGHHYAMYVKGRKCDVTHGGQFQHAIIRNIVHDGPVVNVCPDCLAGWTARDWQLKVVNGPSIGTAINVVGTEDECEIKEYCCTCETRHEPWGESE